jgi:hypothetical protein
MATLQTSGAISLSQVQSVFGGGNPISMSEYYRGGSYVPSTGAGSYTSYYGSTTSPAYFFSNTGSVAWNGTTIGNAGANATSFTSGGYTYQRGSLFYTQTGKFTVSYYRVRRRQTSVSINTSIPSSGTISMSQFYGGRDP